MRFLEDQKRGRKEKNTRAWSTALRDCGTRLKTYVQLLMCAQVDYADRI